MSNSQCSPSQSTSDRVIRYIAARFARHSVIVTYTCTALCPTMAQRTEFNIPRALIVHQQWTLHTRFTTTTQKPMSTVIQHFYADHTTTVQYIFECSLIKDPSKCWGPHSSHPIQCSSHWDPPRSPALASWALPPRYKECSSKKTTSVEISMCSATSPWEQNVAVICFGVQVLMISKVLAWPHYFIMTVTLHGDMTDLLSHRPQVTNETT